MMIIDYEHPRRPTGTTTEVFCAIYSRSWIGRFTGSEMTRSYSWRVRRNDRRVRGM